MRDGRANFVQQAAVSLPRRWSQGPFPRWTRDCVLGGVMESIGSYLRQERVARGIGLDEVSDITRIPVRQLERLEEGRTAELPGEVFIKGYLRAYAKALGVKPDEVLGRYANSLRATEVSAITLRVSSVPPERGKRFGIAIALVVFAVLATLAMSFLLRPRTQERPEQLSQLPSQQVNQLA